MDKDIIKKYSFLCLIILIIPFVNANFFEKTIELITGKQTQPVNIAIIVGAPPSIVSVDAIPAQTITAGGTTFVTFRFRATDPDGLSNLVDSTARANFTHSTLPGEAVREDTLCTRMPDVGGNAEYECTIGIEYYDAPGTWRVHVAVNDLQGAIGADFSTSFTLASTSAISLNIGSLTWPVIGLASTNVLSNNDPITITNQGNTNGGTPSIAVTAFNIPGVTRGTEFLLADDFRVNDLDDCIGEIMSHGGAVNIAGTTLPRGSSAQPIKTEDIYFCLAQVSAGAGQQDYSTTATGGSAWIIGLI